MQILENGILHYELRIIACNEQENLYMRWHGMAEKHFCGRSNSYTLYCSLVQNACSRWKTYIVLLSFISFFLCVSITIWRWEHVRRYMLWIQYFQWQGIRSLVRNKSKKHTAVEEEWVREIDGKEEKKRTEKCGWSAIKLPVWMTLMDSWNECQCDMFEFVAFQYQFQFTISRLSIIIFLLSIYCRFMCTVVRYPIEFMNFKHYFNYIYIGLQTR